jgi:choline dehydrogenase-like flavoprotein
MAAVGADVHFARRESHGNASAHPCGSGTAKEHLRIKSWPVQGDPLGQANPAWRSRGEAPDNPIRDVAKSKHHPTCTAKMGQDDLSVVDAKLRVYGVKKLRIADGSIMPTITTGNTHAPCVIIGERLAEILNA